MVQLLVRGGPRTIQESEDDRIYHDKGDRVQTHRGDDAFEAGVLVVVLSKHGDEEDVGRRDKMI